MGIGAAAAPPGAAFFGCAGAPVAKGGRCGKLWLNVHVLGAWTPSISSKRTTSTTAVPSTIPEAVTSMFAMFSKEALPFTTTVVPTILRVAPLMTMGAPLVRRASWSAIAGPT